MARVLRMREGDEVRLIDGQGGEASGRLTLVTKRSASVEVEALRREVHQPEGLILIVAPTKHTDRFEWLLEKATELGVEEIIPVWTERSERKVDKQRPLAQSGDCSDQTMSTFVDASISSCVSLGTTFSGAPASSIDFWCRGALHGELGRRASSTTVDGMAAWQKRV